MSLRKAGHFIQPCIASIIPAVDGVTCPPAHQPHRRDKPRCLPDRRHHLVQQMLGHPSIVTTADTYTSVLPETAHRSAQATADMVMKAARTIPGARRGETTLPHIPATVAASGYCQT
jgi:hypothetical protein